ncbi:MAG: peroxiredoxin [Pseudomonadota bacterium]|nr:peroxiredoxin [Pseudomonadota bacterium]
MSQPQQQVITPVKLAGIGLAAVLATASQAQEFRTLDGSNNNLANPTLGQAGTNLLRLTDPAAGYADGFQEPVGEALRGSPRAISNAVSRQSGLVNNHRHLSSWVWQWGQLLDHDLDLTEVAAPLEPLPVTVPADDPLFAPGAVIPVNRFRYDPATGTGPGNPRLHPNALTHYIDASVVYGSDAARANALRAFTGGRLAVDDSAGVGDLLPNNAAGMPNDPGPGGIFGRGPGGLPPEEQFLAGDARANEQAALAAAHTVLVREHNRLADAIAAAAPALDDEAIYRRARAIVGAQLQAITYNEWLPALLGQGVVDDLIGRYAGYDPLEDPRVSAEFSTAGFRIGHTLLIPDLLRLRADGSAIAAGHLPLRDAFFVPDAIRAHGIEPLLRGLAAAPAQEIDTRVVEDVRSFLFGPPGPGVGGFDLVAINIQRGRDLGLADYNSARAAFGLDPVTSFADITGDPGLQLALADAYGGNIDNIDLFIGMLAEDHLPGASVGELLAHILADQFRRARDADRFFYLNDPFFIDELGLLQQIGATLDDINATTLAALLRRNMRSGDGFFQDAVFFIAQVPAPASGLLLALGLILLHRRRR